MRASNLKMNREYEQKVFEWIEEQASNPEIKEIIAYIASSSMNVNADDTNGWDCDWWSDETVFFGGREWMVSGSAFYGSVELRAKEKKEKIYPHESCKTCTWYEDECVEEWMECEILEED